MKSEKRLLEMLKYYRVSQLTDILYLWVKLNIPSVGFLNTVMESIGDSNSIPKKSFLKAMFSFTIKDQYIRVL